MQKRPRRRNAICNRGRWIFCQISASSLCLTSSCSPISTTGIGQGMKRSDIAGGNRQRRAIRAGKPVCRTDDRNAKLLQSFRTTLGAQASWAYIRTGSRRKCQKKKAESSTSNGTRRRNRAMRLYQADSPARDGINVSSYRGQTRRRDPTDTRRKERAWHRRWPCIRPSSTAVWACATAG